MKPSELEQLARLATGRDSDLLTADVLLADAVLRERIGGARVLAIGGAGSIGAATLRALAPYAPAALHVVDQNENSLTELVRDLRSGPAPLAVRDFRALPLDYGAPVMFRFLREAPRYDLVLNFAALKHVRSEKDVYSLLQLLDTNLVRQARFLGWLRNLGAEGRYFCVSTDKAANPVNLMGASKRVMEHMIFSPRLVDHDRVHVTSARFANVAFSDGSLLDGFLKRLQKRQPLAVPHDTRRYFVSLREAGEICLLAAVAAPAGHIVVPRLAAERDLRDLEDIAVAVLARAGLQPSRYQDEDAARAAVESELLRGRYPLLLTPLDTAGEKPYEEFVGEGESVVEIGMAALAAVPAPHPADDALAALVERLHAAVSGSTTPSKEELVAWIAEIIPTFQHAETWKHLDQRM